MRVYLTSDLHFGLDNRGDRSTALLAEYVNSNSGSSDVLMILGDHGYDSASTSHCLELFNGFMGKKMATCGNHDVWVGSGQSSLARYQEMARLFANYGFWPLDKEPAVVDGVGFVGVMGWYDYSFKYKKDAIPLSCYQAKEDPTLGASWEDGRRVRFDTPDERVTEWQLQLLHHHIQNLPHNAPLIVGMHHVPTLALLSHPRWLVPKPWRFLNAFLGSSRFQQLLSSYANRIALVACGHIHLGKETRLAGVPYVSVGSTYHQKELITYEQGVLRRRKF